MWIRFSCSMIVAACTAGAQAHGGGLNAEGCHNDRKNGGYHCHRAPAAVQAATAPHAAGDLRAAQPAKGNAAAAQPAGPKCYVGPRGGTYTLTASGRKNYGGC